jgi:hypothetical protein
MPIAWRIADGIVHLESIGSSTFAEWCDAIDQFLAHPDYRSGMGVLHDWRRLTSAPPTTEVRARADHLVKHAARFGRMRWALVVGSADVSYGMARMAEALVHAPSQIEVRAFRDPGDAEAWVRG